MSTQKMRRVLARSQQAAAYRTYDSNIWIAALGRAVAEKRARSQFGPISSGLVTR